MFSKFKSLHVLILLGHCVEELPSSIRELIHLRCLDISGMRYLRCLPDSIGEVYHLQTLRACNALEKLPSTMKHLISLRHLHIPRIELPPEMGRLSSLRSLPYFGVGDEEGCRIGELGSLKNLQGGLEIYNLENVYDKEEAKRANLLQKSNIVKLKLEWREVENREGENGDESVLEGLQPHPNLKSLYICGFGGRSLPSWCSEMSALNNLMEIRLQNCTECEQLPTLGHLPHLKNLHLIKLEKVKSIGSSFYGIEKYCGRSSNTITVFPALERLELVGMSKLTEWLEAELMPNATENRQVSQVLFVVFPCLKYLEIDGWGQLMSAPSHFPCLQELGISRVHSGLTLASICGVQLISLEKLRIVSVDGLVCIPDRLFNKNQNLSLLMIWSCPNLTHLVPCFQSGASVMTLLEIWDCSNFIELPDDLHSLSALERLSIHRCPNLTTIPYPHDEQLLGFSCLRHLSITQCTGLTNLATEMIDSCSLSLEKLELRVLTSLSNMGVVIGYCLQNMLRLSKLVLVDVPMNLMITTNSIGSSLGFFNLRKLRISTCDEYSHSSVVDAILKASTKSLRIFLHGEDCSQLPEQLQHLTAVSQLCLYNFTEIEELPDWVGNNNKLSSSLHKLRLSNCKKLRRLPSKEAMLRLTKLTDLEIYKCPMLNLKKSSDGDSEWPKISHITYVTVDEVVIPTNAH